MNSKTKLLGHAVHPMLVHVPLGLFVVVALFDTVDRIAGQNTDLTIAAFWNTLAGVVAAVLAAFFGLLDLLAIPRTTRAFRIGVTHGFGNLVMTSIFGACAIARWAVPGYRLSTGAFVLELFGMALGVVMGWLGAELIERLGVSVDDSAHLDAPSSLRNAVRGRSH
jgi:uncharacterized membrane protein